MNATKRKFNTLLQGLGRSSSETPRPASNGNPTATPKKTSDVDALLEKRRRLGLPQSNSTGLSSTSPVSLRKASSPAPGSKVTEAKTEEEKPLAKYCPSDRAELVRRLATFQELTDWAFKPDRVSEVEWAKRGWVCKGKETVRCVLCHKELVVKLNRREVDGKEVAVLVSSEIDDALVDKYVVLIIESHLEDCLWRKRGCDDSILRLPLASTNTALQDLRLRYDELCTRKSFLPYEFNLRLPDGLSIDEVLENLPPDFFNSTSPTAVTPPSEVESPNRVALALALLGWQGLSNKKIGAVPNSASCHTCLRRLGLWMFKSKEVSDTGEILVPAPMDHLEPTREHRFFCPWKNADAQKRPSSKAADETPQPGWVILLQTLKNDAHLRSVYAGRSSSRPKSTNGTTDPSTPIKRGAAPAPDTPDVALQSSPFVDADQIADEEYEKEEEARDKERWARLKRVKSLFNIKDARKKRPFSRPGTGHSTKTTAESTMDGAGEGNE